MAASIYALRAFLFDPYLIRMSSRDDLTEKPKCKTPTKIARC